MALHVDKKGAPALSARADRIKKGEPGIRLANSRSADALVMRSIKVQKKRYVKIEFRNSIHLRMICACCVATALLLLLPTVSASAPKQSGYSKHDAAGEEVIPPEKRAELEHYTLKIGQENVITQAAPYSNQYDPLYRSIWLRGKGFDQHSVGVLWGKVAGGLAMGLLGRTPLLYFQPQAMHFVEFPLAIGGGGGICVFAKQGTGSLHYKGCPIAGLFAGSLLFAQYQMIFDNDTKSLYGFTLKLPIPLEQNWKDDWWIGPGGG